MWSAGKEIPKDVPKVYSFGAYKITDVDGNGRLSSGDKVVVTHGKERHEMKGGEFIKCLDRQAQRKLLATPLTKKGAFAAAMKKWAPTAKHVAGLYHAPKDEEAFRARQGVGILGGDFHVGFGDKTVTVKGGGYEIPTADVGAKEFLRKQGYVFVQKWTDPSVTYAYPATAIRAAASDAGLVGSERAEFIGHFHSR